MLRKKIKNAATRPLLLIGLLLLLIAKPAAADELERVKALRQGGAPHLALRVLRQIQPPQTQLSAWMVWERERYTIYRALGQWQALADRVDQLPAGLPAEFRRWATLEASTAALLADQPARARKYLRILIWEPGVENKLVARARRLVIRSYLEEDNVGDALTALLRYKQDYNARSNSWQQLHATVLMRAGRHKDAYAVLAGIQTYDARLLRLLAGLRAGLYSPATVITRVSRIMPALRRRPDSQRLAWLVLAEAAKRGKDRGRTILALEGLYALGPGETLTTRLVRVKAEDLWRAYFALAEVLGNANHLLVGDDDAWLKMAKSFVKKSPVQARAFYAFIAFHARSKENRQQAHQQLVDALFDQGQTNTVIALYAKSDRFSSIDTIPQVIRFRLANIALTRYDIRLAAKLMQGLDTPPEGEDLDRWALRRARIQIYAGEYAKAIRLLNSMLDGKETMEVKLIARFIQVMFDLQAAQKHRDAYKLLNTVYILTKSPQIQRELLFWMADSKYALRNYQYAAELYLRSATHLDPVGGDLWGQTARYKAAEALGKAGLVTDARAVYLKLLRGTRDAKQRALIRRNIQQLWLYEKKTTMQ